MGKDNEAATVNDVKKANRSKIVLIFLFTASIFGMMIYILIQFITIKDKINYLYNKSIKSSYSLNNNITKIKCPCNANTAKIEPIHSDYHKKYDEIMNSL